MIGETFRTIIAEQFRRLRDGDRYWHEHDPYFLANPALLAEVRSTTLADVIRRNTRLDGEVPASVFGGLSPVVTIAADVTAVDEGAPVTFTLTRSGALSAELPLDFVIAESGAMLLGAPSPSRRATFGVGQDTITFSLDTDDDDTLEHESTVSVSLSPSSAYRVVDAGAAFRVPVRDNDGVAVALTSGVNLVVWSGRDGVPVAEALLSAGGDAAITDNVTFIYEWDEAAARWLLFVPGAPDVPGLNSLQTFYSGRSYLVRVDQPVTWIVPAPRATVSVPGNSGAR